MPTVKRSGGACGGYPDFWYRAIVQSGVAAETAAKFGGSAEIKITGYYRVSDG